MVGASSAYGPRCRICTLRPSSIVSRRTASDSIVILDAAAARMPAQPAIEQLRADGRVDTTTYGELEGLAGRIAAWLASTGIRAGDRVAILADNDAPWIAAYLGALLAELRDQGQDRRSWLAFQSRITLERLRDDEPDHEEAHEGDDGLVGGGHEHHDEQRPRLDAHIKKLTSLNLEKMFCQKEMPSG